MYSCPSPMVYFPLETPSKTSRSSSDMHYVEEKHGSARHETECKWLILTLLGKYISIARIPTSRGRATTSMSATSSADTGVTGSEMGTATMFGMGWARGVEDRLGMVVWRVGDDEEDVQSG